MRRNISSLADKRYDLIVVGGGIFGICVAWDAVLRGLSVALIERGDFSNATSANCFKMVHGGMRYLQHGDLPRIRESSHERRALLRVAPHLVHPMPIVVPTYGHGLKSRGFLKAGLAVYDLLTVDRNQGIADPERQIPTARPLSRQECLGMFPGLESNGLTGGMLFYDGHMYNPPRLALSFLKSAVLAGADAANYVEATSFVFKGSRVVGVDARDRMTGDQLRITGKVVVNAAGPWAEGLLEPESRMRLRPRLTFSRDVALVINRPLTQDFSLALQAQNRDPDALLSRGRRHLFMYPWRGYTLIGVWHRVHQGGPEEFAVSKEEVQQFLDEYNGSYALHSPLTLNDVSMVNAGLILFGENKAGATDLSYGKRSVIVDHADESSVDGLVTVVGVRYTTARGVGQKVVDLAFKKLEKRPPRSQTAITQIHGGNIEDFAQFESQAVSQHAGNLDPDIMHSLVRNHGSAYEEVLRYVRDDAALMDRVGDSGVIKAEVIHAVREEMVQKLSDVVFRRTDLGTGGHPGEKALAICAELMAGELGWDQNRVCQELDDVRSAFPFPPAVPV